MNFPGRTSPLRACTALMLGAIFTILSGCGPESETRATTPLCGTVSGQTIELDLDINMAGFNDRHALVHLPPCYDDNTDSYPVVYLLHGGGQRPESWTDQPVAAAETADRMAVAGDIAPVILVMPPRSTKPTGFPEILDALIDAVDVTYRTVDVPNGRGIGGFSASGGATAQSAFTGAPRVAAVGLFAVTWPDTLGDQIVDGMSERDDQPAVYVNVGDRDRLQGRVPDIERTLAAASLDFTVEIVDGGHDIAFVADRLPAWLTWFDRELSPRP